MQEAIDEANEFTNAWLKETEGLPMTIQLAKLSTALVNKFHQMKYVQVQNLNISEPEAQQQFANSILTMLKAKGVVRLSSANSAIQIKEMVEAEYGKPLMIDPDPRTFETEYIFSIIDPNFGVNE